MDNVGPITSESERKKAISAKQVVQEIMSNQGGTSERSAGAEEADDSKSQKSTILQKFSPKLIKSILELLCDESVSID